MGQRKNFTTPFSDFADSDGFTGFTTTQSKQDKEALTHNVAILIELLKATGFDFVKYGPASTLRCKEYDRAHTALRAVTDLYLHASKLSKYPWAKVTLMAEKMFVTPLLYAIINGKKDNVKKLLKAGANPNERAQHSIFKVVDKIVGCKCGLTPFAAAYLSGQFDTIALVTGHGANFNRDFTGPLVYTMSPSGIIHALYRDVKEQWPNIAKAKPTEMNA